MPTFNISTIDDWNNLASLTMADFNAFTEDILIEFHADLDFKDVVFNPFILSNGSNNNKINYKITINGNNYSINNVKYPSIVGEVVTNAYIIRIDYYSPIYVNDLSFKNFNLESTNYCTPLYLMYSCNKFLTNVHSNGVLIGGYVGGLTCSYYGDSYYGPAGKAYGCTSNVNITCTLDSSGLFNNYYEGQNILAYNCHVYGKATVKSGSFYGLGKYVKCYFCVNNMDITSNSVAEYYELHGLSLTCYDSYNLGNLTYLKGKVIGCGGSIYRCYCRGILRGKYVTPVGSTSYDSLSLSPIIESTEGGNISFTTERNDYRLENQELIGSVNNTWSIVSLSDATSRDFYRNILIWNI